MKNANPRQYYRILGIQPGASPAEIKKAYRKLVKTWHPDGFPHNRLQQKRAEEKLKQINEAYEALQNGKTVAADAPPPKRKVDPEPFYQRGIEYARRDLYKQAIYELTKAILIDPDYVDAYLYRGFIYDKLGQGLRAEKDFNKATKLKLRETNQTYQPRNPSPNVSKADRAPKKKSPWICAGTLHKHNDVVSSIAMSPDGAVFASGSYDGTITLWQLSTGRALYTLSGHLDRVHCVAISPDNRTVASGSSDKTVKLWKLKSGSEIRTCGGWFHGHSDRVLCVAFSPNKKKLASGSADRTVKLWQVSTGKQIRTLSGYSAPIAAIAISSDGKLFASGGLDKALRVREMSGRLIRSIRGKTEILALAFSPDGQQVAIGGGDGRIKLWDWQKGREICTLEGHRDRAISLAFSPDGETLISGSEDSTIKIWNWQEEREICTLTEHRDRVCALAFSPKGNVFVSGSADKTVKVWWKNESS
ncbi:DnaJ domain-containing protein [Lusitaniella coriacea]|uniref:WD40 domain-containing protein n=1 Tax=Lusitaniella coriacea TaxID=1983105 RepID=UPI003CF61D09